MRFLAAIALMGAGCAAAAAQSPIVVDTAAAIAVKVLKPKKQPQFPKFEGTVMNANVAQITVRAKGNDLGIQTFALSEEASAKMQQIVDKGGYQYGDKVTVFYDPSNNRAIKIKGKASKPI